MTLDDVVTMMLATAVMRARGAPPWMRWRSCYVRARLAERAVHVGWVYR